MTRGRFRPLSVWGGEPDSTLPDSERTPGTPREHPREHRKDEIKQQVIEGNTGNTEKTHCHAMRVHGGAEGGSASGVYFRAEIYQDITHDQAGMVQCADCTNRQALGKSEPSGQTVIRCRHPTMHAGLWPVLAGDLWRRCAGYQTAGQEAGGGVHRIPTNL